MRRVKAPNGTVMNLPDAIASGLVASSNCPGVVYVDDLDASPPVPDGAPKAYASKAEWINYAVERGIPRDEADGFSKNDLIKRLTP